MERKKLMALDRLAPTSEMFRLAEQEILKKREEFCPDTYQYEIYIRCQVMDGILKTAFYLTRDLKIGAIKPVYEAVSYTHLTLPTICSV